MKSKFLNDEDECERSSKLEDPLSSKESNARRKAEGAASPIGGSFLTSLWAGSSHKLEMKLAWVSLSKQSWKRPTREIASDEDASAGKKIQEKPPIMSRHIRK